MNNTSTLETLASYTIAFAADVVSIHCIAAYKKWIAPHRGEVVGSLFGRQFLIDEVLTDVQFLRSLGQSSVSAWWWDYLDPMSMVPRDDAAVVAYFKEKYKRIVFGYRVRRAYRDFGLDRKGYR